MVIIYTVQVERLRIKDEEEEEARTQLKLQAAKVTIMFIGPRCPWSDLWV